jgi:hypothetical protein
VTGSEPWKRQPPRIDPTNVDDVQIAIKEHDVDREPHPERVDRSASFEQHRVVRA